MKNIIGSTLNFEIEFKEKVDSNEGCIILNRIENEIVRICKMNNVIFKNGTGNFIKEVK